MSKTAQCIELLKILYARNRVVGVTELAGDLDTNPRNITEYIKELKDVGYDIQTVHGRYGGYILHRKDIFPSVKLSDDEREGLAAGYEYLLARGDFMEKKGYGKAMRKVLAAIMNRDAGMDSTLLANRFPLAMPQEELEARYLVIQQCIANKTVLEIEYLTQKNKTTKRANIRLTSPLQSCRLHTRRAAT